MTTISAPPDAQPTWAPDEASAAIGDQWMAWICSLSPSVNALAGEIAAAQVSAQASQASAASALAFVNKLAAAVEWVSGTTYGVNDAVWSPADFQTYYRLIAGAGTTDPSADTTNWALWSLKAASGRFTAMSVSGGLAADAVTVDRVSAAGPVNEKYSEVDGSVIDLSKGTWFGKAVVGPVTLSVINVPTQACAFILELSRPGTDVTFWSGISRSNGGQAPVLSTSGRSLLGYLTVDAGSTWSEFLLAADLPEVGWFNFLGGQLDSRLTFTRASNGSYFDSSGTLQVASSNVPRFDYNPVTLAARGVLVEPQRTNYLPNNTSTGGGPGVWPTGWLGGGFTANGLTYSLSSPTVENGIKCIDINVAGTATATTTAQSFAFFSATNVTAAASGEVFTGSAYIRLIAGSFANVTPFMGCGERNSSNTFVGYNTINLSAFPSGPTLRECRGQVPRTMTAAAAYATLALYMAYSSGAAINFTIRVGLPQLEKGSGATSTIETSVGAVTRSADSIALSTLPPGLSASEGAAVVEFELQSLQASATVFDLSDGTSANQIRLCRYNSLLTFNDCVILNGGVSQSSRGSSAQMSTGVVYRTCYGWSVGADGRADGGGAISAGAPASLPTVNRAGIGYRSGGGSEQISGWIRKTRIMRRKATNDSIVALSGT